MTLDFSSFNPKEKQTLILKTIDGNPLCPIGSAFGINGKIRYNEISELSFDVPKQYNSIVTPFYDQLIGMNIVEWEGIGQFILNNPSEESDGIQTIKSITAYSLEYEFTYKNIYIETGTYNFWNPVAPGGTVMSFILEKMPSWSIGSIDSNLVGKYRTFEEKGTNVYNFIKNTLQKAYNCIFDFDTFNRKINVKSVASLVPTNPIFISTNNLAKKISIDEDTDNIFTCLGVNGADGVDIRSVNPMGTNKIYNLDYFMSSDNFSQTIINKWNNWKQTFNNYQLPYYNLSVEQALQTSRLLTEQAALIDIKGELISLQNVQAVIIQGIAQGLKKQDDLTAVNSQIASKEREVKAQEQLIESITNGIADLTNDMKTINKATSFETFFTEDEIIALDRYIKEDEIVETSFVAISTESYNDTGKSQKISNVGFSISNSEVTSGSSNGKSIYSCRGGNISLSGFALSGEVISATVERSSSGSAVFSAYLRNGKIDTDDYPYGCLSITGTIRSVSASGSSLSFTATSARLYFTRNTTEYEQRSVEWELYDYGIDVLDKLAYPSYTFDVSAANFLMADKFEYFKNHLAFGERIYLQIGVNEEDESMILTPLVIGVDIKPDKPDSFDIVFSDRYAMSDGEFKLADLLDQSISMGKQVDFSKYNYSAFIDSGASTSVRDFMNSALDVAKNAVLSSSHQAIEWNDAGFRLRKWTDDTKTDYDPRQIWMVNNNIVFTKDNWSTAEMAIGEFVDSNLGTCWGIVAPNIVGTLLAGENLVIESVKKDGGVSVFKVDAEGASLHNAKFDIYKGNAHITLNPDIGIAVGKYPLYTTSSNGTMTLKEDNANFWVDTNGNVYFRGTLKGANGEFSGKLSAATGTFAGELQAATGTFSGNLNAAGGTFKGSLSAATGTFAGELKAATGTFAGSLSAATGTFKGSLSAATGSFAGSLSAATGSFEGSITGGSINIGNGNFIVDSNGNLTAKSGTFYGTLRGNTYLDGSGNNMMSSGKFKANYLEVKGLTVTNSSGQTTFKVDSSGNVTVSGGITMGKGSSISWGDIDESGSDAYAAALKAQASADSVQKYATDLNGEILTAQGMADNALAVAKKAQTSANGAQTSADSALGVANNAQTSADNAQSTANSAQQSASDALVMVATANSNAEIAQEAANTAANNVYALARGDFYGAGTTFISGSTIYSPVLQGSIINGGEINGARLNAFSQDSNTGFFLYRYRSGENNVKLLGSIWGGGSYNSSNPAMFIDTESGVSLKLEAGANISITPGSGYYTHMYNARIYDGVNDGTWGVWFFTSDGIYHNNVKYGGSSSNVAVFG